MRGVFWYEDDLAHRLVSVLSTAERVLERLAKGGYKDPHDASRDIRAEKVIAETGLLLLAASSVQHIPEVQSHTHHLAQKLIPYARSKHMGVGLCLEPSWALDYAQAHICLSRLGYSDAQFDALLHKSLSSQVAYDRERAPHRMLEQQWLMHLWDSTTPYDASLARGSVLNSPLDLLRSSREDVYAFTHALMFVAYRSDPVRLPRPKKLMLAEAEAVLAWCLDEQDYDLGGEVLLTWPLTGKTWGATAAFAFRVLASVEDAAGFLPSPAIRLEYLNKFQGDARTDYALASSYHTIYVMGLLCAAALGSGSLPPRDVPVSSKNSRAATRLLSMLDADKSATHWRDIYDRLSSAEQGTLASFLLAVSLRRKAKQQAFDEILELLRLAQSYGLDDAPIAAQAAELLERFALFAASSK